METTAISAPLLEKTAFAMSLRRLGGHESGKSLTFPTAAAEPEAKPLSSCLSGGFLLNPVANATPIQLLSAIAALAALRCAGVIWALTVEIAAVSTAMSSVKPRPKTKSGMTSTGSTK